MKRIVILLLLLGGCVSAPRRVAMPIPQPRAAPPPAPAPPVAWQDRARTPGNWTYRGGATGSRADFGNLLSVQCARPSVIVMQRLGSAATELRIATGTLDRTVGASPAIPPQGARATTVRFAAGDSLLDAIIYARGKFLVAAADAGDLILPPWPEIARVVEDCRG